MRPTDPGVYLEDIEKYIAHAVSYVSDVSLDRYLADDVIRHAVERVLEIAGEALSKLKMHAPDVAIRVPNWQQIIAFRNVLAHGYAELDHSRVYLMAVQRAPELLTAVRELLKEFPEPWLKP